jgi:hypothetical protein
MEVIIITHIELSFFSFRHREGISETVRSTDLHRGEMVFHSDTIACCGH